MSYSSWGEIYLLSLRSRRCDIWEVFRRINKAVIDIFRRKMLIIQIFIDITLKFFKYFWVLTLLLWFSAFFKLDRYFIWNNSWFSILPARVKYSDLSFVRFPCFRDISWLSFALVRQHNFSVSLILLLLLLLRVIKWVPYSDRVLRRTLWHAWSVHLNINN